MYASSWYRNDGIIHVSMILFTGTNRHGFRLASDEAPKHGRNHTSGLLNVGQNTYAPYASIDEEEEESDEGERLKSSGQTRATERVARVPCERFDLDDEE